MKIGIIGHGVVGSAVAQGMQRLGHEVVVHDPKLGTNINIVAGCNIAFVCVPTPQNFDGSCNTSIVEEVIDSLVKVVKYQGIIAIKSTVTPGFTQKIIYKYADFYANELTGNPSTYHFAFVPEFLREKSAFYDFTEGHDLLVVGTHNAVVSNEIVRAHGHYPKAISQMSPTEAELAKYYSNVFNALRITFANGFYDVCKALDADYTTIKHAMMQRPTMVDCYMDCNDNFRGFAGVCLPKDTAAFAKLTDDLGVKSRIFKTIVEDNKLYKPTAFEGMRISSGEGQVVS